MLTNIFIIKMLLKSKQLMLGSHIKLNEYQYRSHSSNMRSVDSQSLQINAIKLVNNKISFDGTLNLYMTNKIANQEDYQIQSSKITAKIYHPQHSTNMQKQIFSLEFLPPKPYIFDRYSYENYANYKYRKGQQPTRYPIVDQMLKKPKKSPTKSDKNIQMVFCETKFNDFLQKTNEKIQKIYKQQQITLSLKRNTLIASNIIDAKRITFLKRSNHSVTLRIYKRGAKSTLSNYLKQFNTLQKLSLFLQNDQKLAERHANPEREIDTSKTCLLDIVTHKYSFMKKMKKRVRENLYKALFNLKQINILTKINIHQYMKFAEMFVGRDAKSYQIATFMFAFLFGQTQNVSLQIALKTIEQLDSISLHKQNIVIEQLYTILQEGLQVFPKICSNQTLLQNFISLITYK